MSALYPILQSGFISSTDKGLYRPDTEIDVVDEYVLGTAHLRNTNKHFFSKTISALFYEWKADHSKMKSFEFREKVLVEAKEMFSFSDGASFIKWIQLQFSKPTVTDMHVTFLEETVGYILGYDRNMTTSQWFRLLEANLVNMPSKTVWDKTNSLLSQSNYTYDFNAMLQAWVAYPHGYEDLLTTLFVIFGERTAVTTVSDKGSR